MGNSTTRTLSPALYASEDPTVTIEQAHTMIDGQEDPNAPAVLKTGQPVALADQKAQLESLKKAEEPANRNAPGGIPARDTAHNKMKSTRRRISNWVRDTIEAHPELAAVILTLVGMMPKPREPRATAAYRAKRGAVSGTADITVKAPAKRYGVQHRATADGGKSQVEGFTDRAKYTMLGLTPGATYTMEYRFTIGGVLGDWQKGKDFLAS